MCFKSIKITVMFFLLQLLVYEFVSLRKLYKNRKQKNRQTSQNPNTAICTFCRWILCHCVLKTLYADIPHDFFNLFSNVWLPLGFQLVGKYSVFCQNWENTENNFFPKLNKFKDIFSNCNLQKFILLKNIKYMMTCQNI